MKLSEVSTAEPKKLKLSDIQSEAPASDKAAFGVFPKPGMEPETDPNKKTFLSEAGDVAKAGGIGALAGYFTPELMTAGGLAAGAFPPTAPLSPFLLAGGQLARGARLAGAATGGLAGVGGSTLGKVVPEPEKVEVDIPGIQLTRKQLAETAGEFAGPGALKGAEFAARGSPIVGSAIRSLERFGNMGRAEYADAAARELALIAKPGLRERFAGSAVPVTEIKAYRDIYDSLAGLDSAKRREGEMALEGAKTKAQKVISYYSEQARRVQQLDVAEAQRLREKGNTDAQQVIDDAISQVEQRFGIVRKAEAAGKKAVEGGQKALASVGNAQRSRYDIGTALQNKVKATDDVQVKALKDAFDADQKARNKIVAEREAAGIFPENTEAYKNTLAFLNDKLVKGRQPAERVKIDVTEQGVKSAYERVRDAMLNKRVMMEGTEAEVAQQVAAVQQAGGKVQKGTNPATGEPAYYRVYKTSFEALDPVRRKLGEAFDGKPVEGFEGLLKDQAKDLYGRIRAIQVEYAGGKDGPQDMLLRNYSEGKDILNALRIPAGRKVIGADKLNPEYLTQDPSEIPAAFFRTKKGVQDLLQITKDPALVEGSASDYLARKLSGKNTKEITDFLKDNKEWIDLFPGLSGRVKSAVSALERGESIGPKTGKLAESLRTEIKNLPIAAQQQAGKVRTEAEKEGTARAQAGFKRAADIRETGKKMAATVTPEQVKIESILGKGDPTVEIEKLISSGETVKLRDAAPFIKGNPQLMDSFNRALDITLSRMNPKNVADDFERIIKPALLNTGLISTKKAAELSQRIRTVQMTLEPSAAAQTVRWIIKTGIAGEAGTRLTKE
jgi:hypothetical protein